MKDLIDFLNEALPWEGKIAKQFKCNMGEALLLREFCRLYVNGTFSVECYDIVSGIFNKEANDSSYKYLNGLDDIKSLFDKGLIVKANSFKKSFAKSKSSLAMLQDNFALSKSFLELLEFKPCDLGAIKASPYIDLSDYLKDEFNRIKLYEKSAFISHIDEELLKYINDFEKYIKNRLKLSKFSNTIKTIFEENSLNKKEQIIFLALLKKEYEEAEEACDQETLLKLITTKESEYLKNKKLIADNSKLIKNNIIYCIEFFDNFKSMLKNFFLTDEILDKLINIKKADKSEKNKLQALIKEENIFELLEPNIDINNVILPKETKEVLDNILKQQDKIVLDRLKRWGISKSISTKIIFYGPPGTGKTMSALALAKAMKKNILSFDCSKILDKYVGESEKNVRKIFDTYKNIVARSNQSPILLLNEADQFLSTRVEGFSASDKMHNQMQNIFLEQIENFNGIIIATTNFLESFDTAFSRRFEYKIEFKKPDFKARLQIWKNSMPKNAILAYIDFEKLANYNLSGAQIIMVIKNTALKVATTDDGIFHMQDFISFIEKELNSSFDNKKIVGFNNG